MRHPPHGRGVGDTRPDWKHKQAREEGLVGPDTGEAPAGSEETPISSSTITSSGAAVSSTPPNGGNIEQRIRAINQDDATFVDILKSPHCSHVVSVQRVESPGERRRSEGK